MKLDSTKPPKNMFNPKLQNADLDKAIVGGRGSSFSEHSSEAQVGTFLLRRCAMGYCMPPCSSCWPLGVSQIALVCVT